MSAPTPEAAGGLLHEHFARSVARHPECVALEIPAADARERVELTYAELDRRSDAIARGLAQRVRGECVVALLLPRDGPHLVAAQLGVLKAGAAWVCLDAGFPPAHLRALLDDAVPVVLLTNAVGRTHPGLEGFPRDRLLEFEDLIAAAPDGATPLRPPPWQGPASLAYVIHTSGTTGRPKGVMIEHRGIANLVAGDLEAFGLGPGDRLAQGSAAIYDSFVEEVWLALAAGATLVVLDDETVRLGPDLVPWLARERIGVFCPPPTLLRATGCVDPWAALPDLRLLYVGGEALPQDLADRWARGRRMVNGYGPTECSVTATRGDVRPGEPVTIGRPVPGNTARVLDQRLEEVPDGEVGELCLGGVGLARGYLGQDGLTAERFPVHPRLGRLYRTGDLVRRDARGELVYLGRLDAQVKLRGHRVELGAIEAALETCPGVRAAACWVQGEGAGAVLAAHVVPADPTTPPRWREVEAHLRAVLPAAHVPARFGLLEALPTTAGGKLDRAALPDIGPAARTGGSGHVTPRDPLERAIATAACSVLHLQGDPCVEADFFLDLGGTSITAAELISLLRGDPATAGLAVRDVYEARTIAGLAARARAAARPAHEPRAAGAPPAAGRPLLFTLAQGLSLLAGLLAASALLYLVWFVLVPFVLRGLGLIGTLVAMPLIAAAVALLVLPLSVALLVVAKRMLIGRYVPGRAPLWTGFHLRHWVVTRLAALVPWSLLQDTVLIGVVLRLLGARVGRRVHVHRGVALAGGGWDLLELGDEASLGQEAALRTVELRDGHLVLGPVAVGAGAVVGTRAGISAHASLGEDAELTALSWLPRGAHVPSGERWDGIPAGPAGRVGPLPRRTDDGHELTPVAHALLTLLARGGRGLLLWSATFALLSASLVLALDLEVEQVLRWLYRLPVDLLPLSVIALLVMLAGPLATILSALLSRALGPVRSGVTSRWGTGWLRVLSKIEAVRSAGTLLSGTLFWPAWLRLAGMRTGSRCEVSTIIDVVPELVEIGAESFLADGIYLGGPRVRRGTVELAPVRLGRGTFLGNHVVVPPGTSLPDDVLLGVCTVADGSRVRSSSSWFGHPAFELPQREVVAADRRLTFEPGPLRYATRLFWELARVALPLPPIVALLAWLLAVSALPAASPAVFHLLLVPALTLAPAAALVLLVLALKWLLLGRVRPAQHPLWSCWCSRWDFLYVAWGAWARPFLATLEGTLMLPWFLRAMGARIGRRVALGAGFAQVVDPDMLHLEDGATVAALFQAHSFEDRVLKIDHVRIGPRASVESGTVLLYGADIGAGARVAPHGVVMKHERLLDGQDYAGAPTRPRGGPDPGSPR